MRPEESLSAESGKVELGAETALEAPPARRITLALAANTLLRIAGSAGGALVGFYLAAGARQGRPFDPALVGLLAVVANGTEVIGAIPLGLLVDRSSPRLVLTISTLVGALATQIFAITTLVAVLFFSRSLESVAAIAGGPALLAFLAYVTRHDHALRGRTMGYYELSLLAGLSLGVLIGGILWDWLQVDAFALIAAVYLVAAALFWWATKLPATDRSAPAQPLADLWDTLRNRQLLRLAPGWLAVNAVIGLWLTHLGFQLTGPGVPGQYLVGRFDAREAGFILLGSAVALSAGVVGWSRVIDKLPRARALRIALFGLLLVCLWVSMLNSPIAWPLAVRYLFIALLGISLMIGSGFTPVALVYLADITGQREGRGAALGVYTMLFSLGNMLGAGLGGLLAQRLALTGIIAGTVGLVAVALAALTRLNDDAGQTEGEQVR